MRHTEKVKLARRNMTLDELKRPKDRQKATRRTSIWDSAWWEEHRARVALKVANREEVAQQKAAERKARKAVK